MREVSRKLKSLQRLPQRTRWKWQGQERRGEAFACQVRFECLLISDQTYRLCADFRYDGTFSHVLQKM